MDNINNPKELEKTTSPELSTGAQGLILEIYKIANSKNVKSGLTRKIRNIVHDRHDAEDIIHDVIKKIAQGLHTQEAEAKDPTNTKDATNYFMIDPTNIKDTTNYLMRAVERRAQDLNQLARHRHEEAHEPDGQAFINKTTDTRTGGTRRDQHEIAKKIQVILSDPETNPHIFLAYIIGKTLQEISHETGLSEDGVRRRVRKTRNLIRVKLSEDIEINDIREILNSKGITSVKIP